MLRCLLTALVVALTASAASAHEGEPEWTVSQSGPRLGLPADAVLQAGPVPARGRGLKEAYMRLNRATGSRPRLPRSLPARSLPGGVRLEYHLTGFDASEPTLGVTPKGTVFFVGFGGLQTSSVLRSRDDGRTWEETNPITPIEGDTTSFDPYIHVDEDTGRVFNADLSLVACSVVSTSDDEGDTWGAGSVCNHTDHQNLFTGKPVSSTPVGYPNLVYYCAIDGGAFFNFGTFTACSRSLDGGRTFHRLPVPPFTDDPRRTGGHYGVPGHCGGNVGHGTTGPDGTIYLPRGWCDQPYLAISRDEGLSWERVQVADLGMAVGETLEEHEASVSVDPAGNVYYAWIARDRLPYLVVSADGGKTWSKPHRMSAPAVNEAWNVIVDAGDPGRIAFSYVGTSNSPGGPFCVRTTPMSCETAAGEPPRSDEEYEMTTWHAYVGSSYDALADSPHFESAPANDPARPIMRRVSCGPSRCGIQFDFLDIDVAPDGTAWAAFVDGLCEPEDPEASCAEAQGAVARLRGDRPLIGTIAEQLPAVQVLAPAPPPAAPPRRCLRGRRLVVRIKRPKRGVVRSTRVTANGRRVQVRRGRAIVNLRRIGRGRRVVVRVVVRTSTGRKVRRVLRYRTCP